MLHSRSPIITIAILGANTVVEIALAQLLEGEGYASRLLENYPTGRVEKLLEGVDVLLLTPGLNPNVREAFLSAVSSIPTTATIPVLALLYTNTAEVLHEETVPVVWPSPIERLTQQIEAAFKKEAAVDPEGARLPAGYSPDHSDPDVQVLRSYDGTA